MKPREEIQEKCEQIIRSGSDEDRRLAHSILNQLPAHSHLLEGRSRLWCIMALRTLNGMISEMNATYPKPADLDILRSEMQEWIATCDGRTMRCLYHVITDLRRCCADMGAPNFGRQVT